MLQEVAESRPYMQYVAFKSATGRHVPVLLTDGNTMILYAHIQTGMYMSGYIAALLRFGMHHFF